MYERSHDVLPSDVWGNGTMKPRRLIDCLQDTADLAVRSLDADTQTVLSRGYAWVLVHGDMFIRRWPELGERLTIRTWHNVNDGLYVFRAFDVSDKSGSQLCECKTSWLLIDLARGRPVKSKPNLPQIFINDGESNPNVSSEFVSLPKEMEGLCSEKIFEVRAHDLDSNDHVNNAVYIEWAVESVMECEPLEKNIRGWDVNYRKSAHLGDTIKVESYKEGSSYTSMISSGKVFLCAVRTYWNIC